MIIRWLSELVAAGRTWPDVDPPGAPGLALEALDQEAKNGGLAGILELSGRLVRRPRRAPEIGRNVDDSLQASTKLPVMLKKKQFDESLLAESKRQLILSRMIHVHE